MPKANARVLTVIEGGKHLDADPHSFSKFMDARQKIIDKRMPPVHHQPYMTEDFIRRAREYAEKMSRPSDPHSFQRHLNAALTGAEVLPQMHLPMDEVQ